MLASAKRASNASLVPRERSDGISITGAIVLSLSMVVFAVCSALIWHVYRVRRTQRGVPVWANLL